MLGNVSRGLITQSAYVQACRFIRARWERGYYKDLYHRRQLIGADPLMHRSSYPNWNYDAEVYAFGHRIGASDVPPETLVNALTTESYFKRADIAEGACDATLTQTEEACDGNTKLAKKGRDELLRIVLSYLRCHLPLAPEEFIQAIGEELCSEEQLSNIAKHLGIDVIMRTGEHPPSPSSIASTFCALLAALGGKHTKALAIDMVIPQIIDIDFADVYPLRQPLAVLTDLLVGQGAKESKTRLIDTCSSNRNISQN